MQAIQAPPNEQHAHPNANAWQRWAAALTHAANAARVLSHDVQPVLQQFAAHITSPTAGAIATASALAFQYWNDQRGGAVADYSHAARRRSEHSPNINNHPHSPDRTSNTVAPTDPASDPAQHQPHSRRRRADDDDPDTPSTPDNATKHSKGDRQSESKATPWWSWNDLAAILATVACLLATFTTTSITLAIWLVGAAAAAYNAACKRRDRKASSCDREQESPS